MASSKRADVAVDPWIAALDHPMKPALVALCDALRAAHPALSTRIRWNAPSFGPGDDDRVTFRLPPKGGLQLVLHRGAKVKDTTGFRFDDPTGLVVWAAVDRGVLTFADAADALAKRDAVCALVGRWIAATA